MTKWKTSTRTASRQRKKTAQPFHRLLFNASAFPGALLNPNRPGSLQLTRGNSQQSSKDLPYHEWTADRRTLESPETGAPTVDPETGALTDDPDTGTPTVDPDTEELTVDPETSRYPIHRAPWSDQRSSNEENPHERSTRKRGTDLYHGTKTSHPNGG